MDFGEFDFSDSDFAKDNALSPVDDALLEMLKKVETGAHDAIENLKINNTCAAHEQIVSLFHDFLIIQEIMEIEDTAEEVSEEEVEALLDKVMKASTKLTFANLNDVLRDDDTDETWEEDKDTNSDVDNSLDF